MNIETYYAQHENVRWMDTIQILGLFGGASI